MRGINHPSIVKLNSFFESPEHYFLVLECKRCLKLHFWTRSSADKLTPPVMEGGELFHQIVKLTYFSENLSRHVILQVAEGIRYLHEERGVVHRDIKPENLLFRTVAEDADIMIADFGLSRIMEEEKLSLLTEICGTPGVSKSI